MEYITTKEAAQKWGISTSRITFLANEGRIPGANRLGKSWLIPATATKPEAIKANHTNIPRKEPDKFSFPLYHLRPDWSYLNTSDLSKSRQRLLEAETAVFECRFEDAYPILKSLLKSSDDIVTEIGCLWNAGICAIALNKPKDFSKFYLRLQMLLAEDFPHRDDLVIILDSLKTYTDTMDSVAHSEIYNIDIHNLALPMTCIQIGYSQLTKESMEPGKAEVSMLEIILHLLESTGAIVAIEWMHCYLLGIYFLRDNMPAANKHAEAIVSLAYENKLYYPLVMYYHYFIDIFSLVLEKYPVEFQEHCHRLVSQYEENFSGFIASKREYAVISHITDEDYPYIYGVITNLPYTRLAEKLDISPSTVKRRISTICVKFGVKNRKELLEFLHSNM